MNGASAPTATSLAELPSGYRVILCDLWGCVHDGVRVFPRAEALLMRWRDQGRIVLLLTNAPRPAAAVRRQLDGFGLDRGSYDAIISSGDTGLAALRSEGRDAAGFIGTPSDREALAACGLTLANLGDADVVVCTGLEPGKATAEDHLPALTAMRASNARLLVFNPDRMVLRGETAELCAGVIGDLYQALGGRVEWYGKPYAPIYDRSLAVAAAMAGGAIERTAVVAIGDSLATDYLGAVDAGLAFVFVTAGIEKQQVGASGGDALIAAFAAERGLGDAGALAIVARLE